MLAVRIHLISAVCLFDHGLILTVTRSANIQIAAGFQFVVGSMTICALHTSGNMSVSEIRACVSSKSSDPAWKERRSKTNTFFIVISEEAGDEPLPIQDLLKCRIGKAGDILTYMTTVD